MADTKMVKKYMIALWIDKNSEGSPDWLRVKKSEEMDLALNPEIVERDYIVDEFPSQEIDKYKPSLNQSLTMYKGEADYEALFPLGYSLPTGSKAKRNVLIGFLQEPVKDGVDTYTASASFVAGKEWYKKSGSEYNRVSAVTDETTFEENSTLYIKDGSTYTKASSYSAGEDYYSKHGAVYTAETIASATAFSEFTTLYYKVPATVLGYKAWKTDATLSFTNINGKESKLTFDINFGGTIEKGYVTPDTVSKKPVFTKIDSGDDSWTDPFEGN